jgi:hypothetical protein
MIAGMAPGGGRVGDLLDVGGLRIERRENRIPHGPADRILHGRSRP